MPWHPPIPAEAVYRPEVATIGAGLRLLFYFYNSVGRDGEFDLSLTEATEALEVEYETLRKWWQAIKKTGIVAVVKDKGHNGLRVRMHRDWIDWHVQKNNFPNDAQRENITVEGVSTVAQPSLNGSSTVGQRENITVEHNVYGTHNDQESSPPTASNNGKRNPDRGVVVMLYDKGFTSSSAINAIARLGVDCETLSASVDNLRADGWKDNGRIMRRLQEHPPEPGQPYPRARAPSKPNGVLVATKPNLPAEAVPLSDLAAQAREQRNRNAPS